MQTLGIIYIYIYVSTIFIGHLHTGYEFCLCDLKGTAFAPRFSNDWKKVLLSLSRKGATNILEINIRIKNQYQLQKIFHINTSASHCIDDKSIVFISDRNGSPHIYTMNQNGGNLSRISFGYSTYSDPTSSTQGNLIVCTKSLKKTILPNID